MERAPDNQSAFAQGTACAPGSFALVAIALALTASSTGTAIPSLKKLAASDNAGVAAGLFIALHVIGTLVGAVWLGRRVQHDERLDWRALVAGALLVSTGLNAAMYFASSFALLGVLRFVEGVSHIATITVLMAVGVPAEPRRRDNALACLGILLVIGVGSGMAIGGFVGAREPRLSFLLASLLCGLGAGFAWRGLRGRTVRAGHGARRGHGRLTFDELRPGVLVACERFVLGILAVSIPFLTDSPRQSGTLLGSMMLASVLVAPLARMAAARVSRRAPWTWGCLALSTTLLLSNLGGGFTGRAGALLAIVLGAGAGAIFVGALLEAGSLWPEGRVRAMGMVHALGGLGFMLGSMSAGVTIGRGDPRPAFVALVAGAVILVLFITVVCFVRLRVANPVPARAR